MNKKGYIAFAVALILIAATALMCIKDAPSGDYIRIHIRANSDLKEDQDIKIKVRDEVVEYLIPLLAECEDYSSAKKTLKSNLKEIEEAANRCLRSSPYAAKASMVREEFPARKYGDLVLDQGVYDALIIDLGTGEGANWWCVAFPPLCFIPNGGGEVIYRSKILEIIKKFTDKN